jgi:AcrR family transcriptional regulator
LTGADEEWNNCFKMKRLPASDRRTQLVEKTADYILSHGLADLSLRPLAASIGTSPRMLLYFFNSKEQLVTEALVHVRIREQLGFRRSLAKTKSASREELLVREWKRWSSRRREKYMRLFFEIYGLALQNPDRFRSFLPGAVHDWLPLVERALNGAETLRESEALATLGLAAVRGLQLDLLATGERARIEAAFRALMERFFSAFAPCEKMSSV